MNNKTCRKNGGTEIVDGCFENDRGKYGYDVYKIEVCSVNGN